MPYKRAVIRAEGRYIKIFRPGSAAVPAERCAQMDVLLDAGAFTPPRILRRSSQDVIVFSAIAGPTLYELGEDGSAAGDDPFVRAWEKWSRAWVARNWAVPTAAPSKPFSTASRSVRRRRRRRTCGGG